jgi:hypothetical protein
MYVCMYVYSTYLLYINLVYQYVCMYYICTYNTVYIQEVHTHDCILELGFKSNDMNMGNILHYCRSRVEQSHSYSNVSKRISRCSEDLLCQARDKVLN